MNRYLILVCLVLTGCPLKPATVTTQAKVVDDSGNNRLLLRFIEEPMPGHGEDATAYDFHSLVWEVRNDGAWKAKAVVTQAAFQQGSPRRRWVSEIHSLDPMGLAIIKVAEEKPGKAPGSYLVEYSWRKWDVGKNQEVQLLRVCRDPFEAFSDSRN